MSTILIIEDETSLREELLFMLKMEGFEVFGAENGVVGVEMAQQHKPDLILCDIMMPELDGLGVLQALRANVDTQNIPIVFISARTLKKDQQEALDLGGSAYITKPFTAEKLLDAIDQALEGGP